MDIIRHPAITIYVLVLSLFATGVSEAYGIKILLVPLGINTHVLYFSQLGIGLQREGHNVTLIVPTHARVGSDVTKSGVKVIWFNGEEEQFIKSDSFNAVMIKMAKANSFLELFIVVLLMRDHPYSHWSRDCEAMLSDPEILTKVKESKYDFAIVDTVFPPCIYTLPYKFDIPYAGFGIHYLLHNYRVPAIPSSVPSTLWTSTEYMSFFKRVENVLIVMLEQVMMLSTVDGGFISRFAPERPNLTPAELVQKSKIQFFLSDPILGVPTPKMPNTEFIGDIMARPAKPLDLWLELLVASAPRGVVLVSLGSMMGSLPGEMNAIMFEALGKLDQEVIMKKPGRIPENVAENIHLLDWLPQNDLLGHDNVKLFVTHCGLNSLIETVYHGKPIVGIPIFFDQPHNGLIAANKGLGVILKYGSFTTQDLLNAIRNVLAVPAYKEQAMRMSRAFRDKPQPAAARASFLINHVIKHGDAHLRTGAFQLNHFQFLLLDVLLFLLAVVVICLYSCFCCIKLCNYRICYEKRTEMLKKH